jgi:hypothetical protein
MTLYNGSRVNLWSDDTDIGYRFGCDHTSFWVTSCIKKYVDLDRDGGVTAQEIDAAKSTYMHWYEKLFDFVANAGSSEDMQERCDLNENGKIDIDDLIAWNRRCLQYSTDEQASSRKGELCLCNCESINAISEYICDRAKN